MQSTTSNIQVWVYSLASCHYLHSMKRVPVQSFSCERVGMLDFLLATQLTFAIGEQGCPKSDKECQQVLEFCEPTGEKDVFDCPDWAVVDSRVIPKVYNFTRGGF
eukprot:g58726.t1